MAFVTVLLPQFSMGMTDGEIVRWCKGVGDLVEAGETLVEIEAAKTTVELPSPCRGRLAEILCAEGETVEIRVPIARLEIG
jgi:pyruvate/2-oxoglutarate dehydrogenase complex dihydrolipoamide acyltransferase (E2) component